MTDHLDDNRRARLELNARGHRHDPALERAADLFHTDRAAWNRLPQSVRSASSVYADLRQHHRDAVEAGVITPRPSHETPPASRCGPTAPPPTAQPSTARPGCRAACEGRTATSST
jgi:hypothetical protein